MSEKQQRIGAIDGLRAIAVICVLIYHLFPKALPGGFIGVDIFFVISGYVVCGSLLKSPIQNFWSFVSGFYARRVLRIYPALIAVLTTTGILSRLFIPDSYLSSMNKATGLAAFFGASNFLLVFKTDGYFSHSAELNPFLHTWSLAVEEQFYFLFPLILFLLLRFKPQNSIVGRLTSALLPGLFLISLAFSAWETFYRHESAYYLLPSRFWELALGVILCLQHAQSRLIPTRVSDSKIFVLAGLGSIGVSLVFTDITQFPFPWAIAPAVGTALCITGLVQNHANLAQTILSSRPVTYLGRISYSLYLWHWPAIVLLRWTTGVDDPIPMAAAVLITCLAACLSYHLIEKPFQRFRPLLDQWTLFVVSTRPDSQANSKVLFGWPTNLGFIFGGLAAIVGLSVVYQKVGQSTALPLSVTMRPGSDNLWKPDRRGIAHQKLSKGVPGHAWSGKNLFVIGDSHAGSYAEMVNQLRQHEGVSVYMFTVGDIRIGSLVFAQRDFDREAEQTALKALGQYAHPGDVVLLASLRVFRFGSQWGNFEVQDVIARRESEAAEQERQIAVREGKELIRKLEAMGLVVVIEAPKPVFLTPAFRCSDWFNRMNPIGRQGFVMDRDFLLEHRSAAMRSIEEIRQEYPSVRVWDAFWVFCQGSTCSIFEGDKPLFFDNDHISSYGNQKAYPDFVKHMDTIWGTASIASSPDSPKSVR